MKGVIVSFTLYPHQEEVLDRLSNGQILCGGVGTGKSLTVLVYYLRKEAPKDIYVITTAKKRDSLEWEGDGAKLGISTVREYSQGGKLTVDSWNNIDKYLEIEDAFFIFDEQRVVGSGAWAKNFVRIAKKNRWVLLSATPGDTWMDYVPVFIANGLYRNSTEFKREHVVYAPFTKYPKIVRYLSIDVLEKYRSMILVEMPYIRHTERHLEWVKTDYDAKVFERVYKDRWNVFEDEPIKDVAELFRVMRRVVNSDPSRVEALRTLMKRHPRLIVFYNFNYELEILRELCGEITVA